MDEANLLTDGLIEYAIGGVGDEGYSTDVLTDKNLNELLDYSLNRIDEEKDYLESLGLDIKELKWKVQQFGMKAYEANLIPKRKKVGTTLLKSKDIDLTPLLNQ